MTSTALDPDMNANQKPDPRRRMKNLVALALGTLALAAAGCLPTSLNPLYETKDLTFDPALLGTWGSDEETWTFEKGEDQAYKLTIAPKDGRAAAFEAHLFKLGDASWLDIYPGDEAAKDLNNGYVQVMLCPTHAFLKVTGTKPNLTLVNMDLKWLLDFLTKHPKATPHHIVAKEGVVLTGSTAELRAFVREHLKTEGAWNSDPLKLEPKTAKR
jgi:hypothetical protein